MEFDSLYVGVPDSRLLLSVFRYVGINASDVNFSAGRYDPSARPPFDAGFEVSSW